jgi:hypothetical protein
MESGGRTIRLEGVSISGLNKNVAGRGRSLKSARASARLRVGRYLAHGVLRTSKG